MVRNNFSSIKPDQIHSPRKSKRKETTALLLLRKEPIPDIVNPRKISQGDYLMPPEKESPHKISQPFQRKEEYEGDNNEKNNNIDDSQSGNDDFLEKNQQRTRE